MAWSLLDLLVYLLGVVVLTAGGNLVCRVALKASGVTPPRPAPEGEAADAAAPTARAGRVIGSLERALILVGLAAGAWEILAAVIALKTVSRFKELDTRLHAEYFLVGSLVSVLWATVVCAMLIWFDSTYGFDLAQQLRAAKGP
jgi:hypothetical protein